MSAPVHLCFSFSPSVLCKRLPQETETATVCFDSVFLFVFFGCGGGGYLMVVIQRIIVLSSICLVFCFTEKINKKQCDSYLNTRSRRQIEVEAVVNCNRSSEKQHLQSERKPTSRRRC